MSMESKRKIIVILMVITAITCFISMTKLGIYKIQLPTRFNISKWDEGGFESVLGIRIKVGATEFGEKLQQFVKEKQLNKTKPLNVTTKLVNVTTKKPSEIRETMCDGCFGHNFKYLINNENICKGSGDTNESVDLFIMILTIHKNVEQRNAIRKTWLTYSKNNTGNIRYAFLLGTPKNDDLHDKVVLENNVHNDIIKEDFIDTYKNLTYKTLMGFKWIVTYCPTAKYVLKTDDDMYINIPNFMDYLKTSGTELENQVGGSCEKIASPIRNVGSKWYASKESYKEKRFPGYCSGTGYITSINVVNKIFAVSPKIPFFHLEDIYVGLCLRKIGGTVRPLKGFNRGRVQLNACLYKGKTMFTSHGVTPKQMVTVWNSKC